MKKVVLILLVASAWLLSCGDGEEDPLPDTKVQEDVASDDALTGDAEGETTTPAGSCPNLPNLTGRAYRVTSIVATDPTDQVNEVWQTDIDNYDLVLIFYVKNHDQVAQTAEIHVTSGLAEKKKEGDKWVPLNYHYALEPSIFTAVVKGCNFAWSEPIELDIQTPTVSKPFHIFGIEGNGRFSEDGSEIKDTWLEGAILESEAFDLCLLFPALGVLNFHWFMNAAYLCPTFDSDGDGKIDSYKFKGKIEAVDETPLFKEGMTPVVPQVTDCAVNDKPCVP